MIPLPEEGDTEEIRDGLLSTWDTYCVVEYLRQIGVLVMDWSLRRGWARVEADWANTKIDVIHEGKRVAAMALDIDIQELAEMIRVECMEHWHSFDHMDFRVEAVTPKVGIIFFKVPIYDDPKHPPFFQLPNKVARARERERRAQAFDAHLREPMQTPLDALPDILPDNMNAETYRAIMERAAQVFREESHKTFLGRKVAGLPKGCVHY